MELSQEQILHYRKNGFLLLESYFSENEINMITNAMPEVFNEDSPRKILDKTGCVRTIFAPDKTNKVFSNLVKLDKIVKPSKQLLEGDIYAHQTKLNSKKAFLGDCWEWHQDFTYWHLEDGMPYPRALTVMIYINAVNEFNGPLYIIPGSHIASFEDSSLNEIDLEKEEKWYQKYQESTKYMNTLSANLKYTVKKENLEKWVNDSCLYSAKGPVGSVFFMHASLYHASTNNLSPWDRNIFMISYNNIQNALLPVSNPRPDFIANRDFTPIIPVNNIVS